MQLTEHGPQFPSSECDREMQILILQFSSDYDFLHAFCSNQQPTITYLLLSHPELDVMLRDKSGWTPFATAMTHKDNKAAQAILDRAPTAADQVRIIV